MVGDSGHYSVCAYGSKKGRITYAAWRTETHPHGRQMIAGNLPDEITAKLVCEDYESRL
jgi:hypothetical protein